LEMAPSSSSSSSSSTRGFLFAALVIVAAVATVIVLAASQDTSSTKGSSSGKGEPATKKEATNSNAASAERGGVLLEDDEESDDEEDDEEAKAALALAKQQKEEYENLISVADKCVKGNAFARAAENYTLALELAPLVPSASKNILTIYNNRSAMYEKLNKFDMCLTDIDIVLSIDPNHIKARVRRARVYEAMDKLEDAMVEHSCVMMIQRQRQDPACQQTEAKIFELSKAHAALQAGPLVEKIRSSSSRNLPTNAYCRNFFDVLSSTHKWRAELSRGQGLQELSSALQSLPKPEEGEEEEGTTRVEAALKVVKCAIADGKFTLAFSTLATIAQSGSPEVSFLCGLEQHLRCNLDKAEAFYRASGDLCDAKLALASVQRELGDEAKALDTYTSVLSSFAARLAPTSSSSSSSSSVSVDSQGNTSTESSEGGATVSSEASSQVLHFAQFAKESGAGDVSTVTPEQVAQEVRDVDPQETVHAAWALVHRQSLWPTRSASGTFRPRCLELAQQDLSIADALVKPIVSGAVASEPQVKESASMASAMLQIRQVNLFTQIKGQVLGGSEMTEEEKARCAECLAAAQKLAPEHESVKTMEADLLAVDGKLDETLTIVETLIAKAEPNDGVPYVIKANYIGQKVRLFLFLFLFWPHIPPAPF